MARKSSKKKNTKKASRRAAGATVKKRAKRTVSARKAKKTAKTPAKKAVKKTAKKTTKKTVKKTVKKAARKIARPAAPAKTKKHERAPEPTRAITPEPAIAPAAAAPMAVTPRKKTAPATMPAADASRGNRFYITTAIAYPNGQPHIGHAYEAIATDALARFARLDGKDVFFLTGTDEHGQKMIQTAQAEGLSPAELATRNAGRFKEMDERLNVSFDRFIRTSEPAHHRSVQAIWKRMQENGDIYIDAYAGWYSVRDEAYYAEDETVVGEDNVRRGPQGTPVEWVEEKSYFFKLSAYQDRLLHLYESQPDFIGPDSRRNEVMSFVRGGLKDLSISRTTFDWGVKVPEDPEHVMYVWVDALTNYITGVGFPDEDDQNWRYWPADVHIIGRTSSASTRCTGGIPAVGGIPVQKRVYAHGFLFTGARRCRSRSAMWSTLQSRRPVRRRPDALFLPARGAVRAGRQLQPRGH